MGRSTNAAHRLGFASLAAALTLSIALLAAPRAQQSTAPAPKALVPLAASTLAADPDPYYGERVTLTGAVDQLLSRSTFSVDQDKTKSTGKDVLIIAPTLIASVDLNTYVTVLGEVVKFEPDDIARRVKDYTLDLAPEVVAKYRGRPAILATVVLNAAMVDVAKRPPAPLTAEEVMFDKIMKRVGPANTALRKGAEGSDAAMVKEQTAVLKEAFGQSLAFWKARGIADATEWAQDARKIVEGIERAAAAANWEEVNASATNLAKACQTCHGAYRERLEDGTFRIKAGTR